MMETIDFFNWLTASVPGMFFLSILGAVLLVVLLKKLTKGLRCMVRPAVEQAFYDTILNKWLGPFFSKHKIIATFIKIQGLGETVVDSIVHLIGTFFVVALLSSTLTAMLLHVLEQGFVYSIYLAWLLSMAMMWTWVLVRSLIYFYRIIHRLK